MYIEIKDDKIVGVSDCPFSNSIYTEKEVVRGEDGYFYFAGEEPEYVDNRSYVEKRQAAYPSFFDYLDAQVKLNSDDEALRLSGQQQLEKYFQECLDVKRTYPKENNV